MHGGSKMSEFSRRSFLEAAGGGVAALALSRAGDAHGADRPGRRPNVVFAFADDWSWPHAGIAGDPVVKTPHFDRVAREGVLFPNTFVPAPSCAPARASVLTGQWHWRLEQGANLHGTLPAKFAVYPDLLERAGYFVGYTGKGWGPGKVQAGGRERNPAGPRFPDFGQFMKQRPDDAPFCFWFGSTNPHRPYERGSGVESGMDPEKAAVPECLPEAEVVRSDVCDYYYEVQQFDTQLGKLLQILEEAGELENTIVVVSGDNGMPFPRCKSTLYDLGTRVPLAIRWGDAVSPGRRVEDFVSLCDLAPTFLQAAGVELPDAMTGRSLLPLLNSEKSGRVDPERDSVLTGKERHHGKCREGGVGYPMRAIRTHDYLYIRNFTPWRWPGGSPWITSSQGIYSDYDDGPTKRYMIKHSGQKGVGRLFDLCFGMRPGEELYDLGKDPGQVNNVADRAEYAEVKKQLSTELMRRLKRTGDPRAFGKGEAFDGYPYYTGYGMESILPEMYK